MAKDYAHITYMAEYWCDKLCGVHYVEGVSKPVYIHVKTILRWIANTYRIALPSAWAGEVGKARMYRREAVYWKEQHDAAADDVRKEVSQLPRLNKAQRLRRNKSKLQTQLRKMAQDARTNMDTRE